MASSCPAATRLTLRQQGGTEEDGHIRLADWTLSVAETEKKKKKKKKRRRATEGVREEGVSSRILTSRKPQNPWRRGGVEHTKTDRQRH